MSTNELLALERIIQIYDRNIGRQNEKLADIKMIAHAALAQLDSADARCPTMTEAQIKYMVDRFLMWKLPEHFNPDCGISFDPKYRSEHGPVGTNLFDATQADAMVRHMTDGLLPDASDELVRKGFELLYVKRWRTLIMVPASIKSDIRQALLSDAKSGLEAAARWHESEATSAKAVYSHMGRYSDDHEERAGWRSYKDKEDRHLYAARAIRNLSCLPDASPGNGADDWCDDPSADERWNAGLDFGMLQFCAALGVDPKDVTWDAATETLDGDVNAAICNILRVKFGDDFDGTAPGNGAEKVREALANLLVEDDSDEADDECELCGGRGTVDAYTDRTRNDQRFEGRDEIGCPCCIERSHSRQIRAALHSTGAAGETTSSDGVPGKQSASGAAAAPIETEDAGVASSPSEATNADVLADLNDVREEAADSLQTLDAIAEYVGCPHDEELTVDHVRQHYMKLENAAQRQGIEDAGRIANERAHVLAMKEACKRAVTELDCMYVNDMRVPYGGIPADPESSAWREAIKAAEAAIDKLSPEVNAPASPPDVEAIRADERERCAAEAMTPVNGMELQRFIVGGVALTDKHGNDVFIAKPDVERLLTERASAIRTGGQK